MSATSDLTTRWVCVEGVNGVGKTYLIQRLAARLGPYCQLITELTDTQGECVPAQVIGALSAAGDAFLRTGHPLTETLALLALKVREHELVTRMPVPPAVLLEDRGVDTVAIYQAVIPLGEHATEDQTWTLTEQGALAFTWLARGRLPEVRAGEQRISASGLAPERCLRRVRLAAWGKLPDQAQRHDELRTAYQEITETVPWPAGLDREACAVVDLVESFGLNAFPDPCHEITALAGGAVLSGTVRCAIGRDLLLDTPGGPLLADTRLLAGWPLHPTTAAPTGLDLRVCDYAHKRSHWPVAFSRSRGLIQAVQLTRQVPTPIMM